MKKFLVVLLALAMILGMASVAMAADTQIPDYNDTKTSTEYAVDIYRLTALGVLCGDSGWGGTYRPSDNLTRAEFAKIACFMFGKQDYIQYYAAQQSAFADVAEGAWYEGWINCAYDNGLMIGVGGGNFAPTSIVTKQEVATVTLRGVGYTDELPGDWPSDYIAKSQEVHSWFEDDYKDGESLFDYVEKIDGTAATRAEMAAIVNYCLDLYRVEYVGDQTMIAGISGLLGVDSDGFAYVKRADTNENPGDTFIGDVMNTIMGGKTDLLWDVFGAYVIPEWQFERWNADYGTYNWMKEAAGWGYEDFAKGELIFAGYRADAEAAQVKAAAETDYGPVATNYYIFDKYLDGQLWQLSDRYAHLTIMDDEAVFAEMLTDVTYVDEEDEYEINGEDTAIDNADLYDYDGYYDYYDYDWFSHAEFAIVNDVAEGDMATVDVANNFGEGLDSGEFCLLDDCDTHDKNYVFLKNDKLQDASCLELNDVVYNAGPLFDGEDVDLYIVITPAKATLKEVVYTPNDEIGDEDAQCEQTYQLNVDGTDYWFCEDVEGSDGQPLHAMSLDGGYIAGEYVFMTYDDLYDKLTGGEGDVRYAAAYAKKYAASIIFGASAENKAYGVVTDFDFKHIYPEPDNYYAKKVDFFGPDGKQTGLLALDESIDVGSGDEATGEELLGTLTNYFLTDDNEVITDEEEEFNWIKYTPGKNDVGYIKLALAEEPIEIETNAKGQFSSESVTNIDGAADADNYGVDEVASAKGMKITADTVIFEVKANKEGEFKSVKIGQNDKYIDAEFTAEQFGIFAWDGNDITVLYVVNPSFAADEQIGLFDVSRADENGGFVKYMEDGTKVYFKANEGKELPDAKYVYAAYKAKDGKLTNVIAEGETYGPEITAGDFVVLVTKYGYYIDEDSAKEIIKGKVENAEEVTSVLTYDELQEQLDTLEVAEDAVYIDLVDGAEYSFDSSKIVHSEDDEYGYILVTDDFGNVLQVIRVLAPEEGGEGEEGGEAVEE